MKPSASAARIIGCHSFAAARQVPDGLAVDEHDDGVAVVPRSRLGNGEAPGRTLAHGPQETRSKIWGTAKPLAAPLPTGRMRPARSW